MILQNVIQALHKTGFRTESKMRNALNTSIVGSNTSIQSTTYATSDSIRATFPRLTAGFLLWDFQGSDTAVRLNTGGSNKFGRTPSDAPYGQFRSPGGQSNYIGALINWAKTKYGLDEQSAKRMAFKVANAASERGRTVKSTGWLDSLKQDMEKQIQSDLNAILAMEINKELNKELNIR
tara:strand:+ start:6552 stop:7088 length:537 start_codon:yes stop_codon:yes gene_type:complete